MSAGLDRKRVQAGCLLGAVLILSVATGASGATSASARTACEANRLRGMLERLSLEAPGAVHSGVQVTLTPSGAFQGLAYGVVADGSETQLAFSITFEQPTLLRNPERPQLFTLNLSRNDLASDLVDRPGTLPLSVTIDPTFPGHPPDPRTFATLDNRPVPGGEASQRPGRGLDHLVAPCGPPLTDDAVHALQVLSRVVRLAGPTGEVGKVVLYPGVSPGVVRIDGVVGAGAGRLAATVRLERDRRGRFSTGTLTVHGRCPQGFDEGVDDGEGTRCSSAPVGTEIRLVTPTFLDAPPRTAAAAAVPPVGDRRVAIDWDDVLGGTTWQAPRRRPDRSLALDVAGSPLVAITAHPDDEALLAPLLGAVCVELEGDCSLVVATRGERGVCRLPGGCLPDLGTVRSEEMARAAAFLHADLDHWDLPDGSAGSPDGVRAAWAAVAGGESALLGRLAAAIERMSGGVGDPGIVLTFDPRHGSTGHADHRALGQLVLDAIATLPTSRRPDVHLLATRVRSVEEGMLIFSPDDGPEGAELLTMDATRWMVRLGAPAWGYLEATAAYHRSQFDDARLEALAAVPAPQRRVWLVDAGD